MTTTAPSAALCSLCQQKSEPTEGCPACQHLREVKQLLAYPHNELEIAMPDTIKVLESKPGVLVMQRRHSPFLAIVAIGFGLFVIGLMAYIFVASGTETLWFVIPLDLVCLASIAFGIRDLRYRQMISLERGTLTATDRKGTITARGIEQLVVDAHHSTWWHKGLRWGAMYKLHARTNGASVLVFSGDHSDVRFVEAKLEAALRIDDDPARNSVTVGGS